VRLVELQVVDAHALNEASHDKRAITEVQLAPRGDIVDSNGTVLARSVTRYDITASPQNAHSFHRTTDGVREEISVNQALTEISEITGAQVEAMQAAIDTDPNSNFAYLVRSVDLEQYRQIRDLRIPWVYPQALFSRTYPN